MNDDFGMMIINEADLDDFFNEITSELPPHNLIPGCNIKTGCYGLILCALDECNDDTDREILDKALSVVFNIKDCIMFNALTIHYPPDVISYETILKLAVAIISINKVIGSVHAEDVDQAVGDDLDDQIIEILGLNPRIIQIMENENARNTSPGDSETIST